MKKSILTVIAVALSGIIYAQNVPLAGRLFLPMVKASWIDYMRNDKRNDTLYIINFWATWCKPCIEELPVFEQIKKNYAGRKVSVILVSNDARKDVEKVQKFVADHKITPTVLLMAETNADLWINKVSKEWSGAIPSTWLIRGKDGKEFFKEGETTYEELEKQIDNLLK